MMRLNNADVAVNAVNDVDGVIVRNMRNVPVRITIQERPNVVRAWRWIIKHRATGELQITFSHYATEDDCRHAIQKGLWRDTFDPIEPVLSTRKDFPV